MDKKGQIISNDLIFGLLIFIFVLSLFFVSYNLLLIRSFSYVQFEDMKIASVPAMQALAHSPGEPNNWEEFGDLNNVSSIGLVSSRNDLGQAKIDMIQDFNALHYWKIKELLGIAKYDFHAEIINLQDNQQLAEFGISPDQNALVSSSTAISNLDGKKVKILLKVFQNGG
ncbi:MAG: hypothetical protein ABID38_02565 [Candidatus Diapherotrites archaeon]